jgi:agmatine deiminase
MKASVSARTAAAAASFRMPAEWERHEATWLAWPHERKDWPGKFEPIPWVYGEIVRRLCPGERVRILVKDGAHEASARRLLKRVGADLAQVDFFRVPTDRSWTRDFCPIWVRSAAGEVAVTDWKFNGWAKYANHRRDDAVPAAVAKALGHRRFEPTWPPEEGGTRRRGGTVVPLERGTPSGSVAAAGTGARAGGVGAKTRGRPASRSAAAPRRVVLEGGSIDVNGCGTLLTTEECLLSPVQARNPGMSREDVERCLGAWLGVTHVVWLGEGIEGDDTHGHVDDLARFVAPGTIVLAQEGDTSDPNHARLAPNLDRLMDARDQDGRAFTVVPLPMPDPLVLDGQRLPASYANFYVGNEVVLVPTFNDPADRTALGILAELFPRRRVVGVHCVDFVWGLGTIHCATQQEPAARA